ncbi:MAG: STM4014 family protein [Peptostreptococcaceae bacterium]|jgi:hypothetical protein|nr:STM4014 family protein [Peptostreptococcaceae bacterium]
MINFLIIGDLKGKRVSFFIKTLKILGIKNYNILSWIDLIKDINILEKYLKNNTIIKIEPPEKDLDIYKAFLKKGFKANIISTKQIDKLNFDDYKIISPKQWFFGVTNVFENIKSIIDSSSYNIFMMNDIDEAIIMMDKKLSYKKLNDNLESKNFNLPKLYDVKDSYLLFEERYLNKSINAFIKLRYGSGSIGVLAYKNNPKKNKQVLYTSLKYKNNNFYSEKKVRKYEDKNEIKILLDWVLKNDAHMESWIPKSKYNDKSFDTRVFMLNQNPNYLISRFSNSPITNLHLDNKRLESKEFLADLKIKILKDASRDVGKVFEKSLFIGLDIVTSKSFKPYIIDVNPFGDLFYNLNDGKNIIYEKEIKLAIKKLRG